MIQDQYYTQLNETKKYTSFETNFIQLATGNILKRRRWILKPGLRNLETRDRRTGCLEMRIETEARTSEDVKFQNLLGRRRPSET